MLNTLNPVSPVMFPDFPAGSTRIEVLQLMKQRMELRGGGVNEDFWDTCPKEIITTPVYKALLNIAVRILPMTLLVDQAPVMTPAQSATQPA